MIGRGTRLYDGKDYFTIYDFVKAYLHFNYPEWDGEPIDPEPFARSAVSRPCQCVKVPHSPKPCLVCGKTPCECEEETCGICGENTCVCKNKATVKLANGKEHDIQSLVSTTFWHPDGIPISAQQFMELLFGKLPEFLRMKLSSRIVVECA